MATERFTIAGARIETLRDNTVRVTYTNGTYRDTNKFHPVNNVGRKRHVDADGRMINGAGMDAVKHCVLLYVDVTNADGAVDERIPGTSSWRHVTLDRDGCYAFLVNHPSVAEWRDVLVNNPPSNGDGTAIGAKLSAMERAIARLTAENAALRGDDVDAATDYGVAAE